MSKALVLSNTFYQLIARFGTVIFTFLLSILLTRTVSSVFWGQYSIVLNYIALFYMLADFGINIVVVKDYSENETLIKKEFSKLFGLKLIAGIILSTTVLLSINILPYDQDIKQGIGFAAILVLFFSLQNSFLAIFQARLQYWKSAVINIVTGLTTFLTIFLYINLSSEIALKNVIGLTVLGYFVGLLLSLFLTKKEFSLNLKSLFEWAFHKILIKRAFFIGLTIVLNSFMFSGDKFLLSLYRSEYEVGVYSLAYKLFELYLVLPTFIMNSYYPLLIKIRVESYKKLLKQINKITLLMIPVWVCLSLVLYLVGPYFISLLWGIEMIDVITPFSILVLTSLPFFITAPLTWIYYIENHHRKLLLIYLIGFLFNIALNIKYIPIYGYTASAYITGLTEVLVLVLLLLGLKFINQSSRTLS